MKEVCWNITSRCNQQCKYCHRFLNVKELSYEENFRILTNLVRNGITSITWTGGEALLLPELDDLLKRSHSNGIKNKLITNGNLLTGRRLSKIGKYLDSITLSIDSTDNVINEKLGRGRDHFSNIKNTLELLNDKYPNIKVRINSVITKCSKDNLKDLSNFLNQYDIYSWRLFKFMPLREKAVQNKSSFEIRTNEYNEVISFIRRNSKIKKIESRTEENMENNYVLILANGDTVITKNGVDVKIGNALYDKVSA